MNTKKNPNPKAANLLIGFISLLFFSSSLFAQTPLAVRSSKTMVVTAHPKATEAALEILEKGGNAADAAIAAQWVLNVAEPQGSGIGGGGFFLYYDGRKKAIYSFDGREKAPTSAYPGMFLDDDGKPKPFFPDRISGGLPVGVPGTLSLMEKIYDEFSSREMTFAELYAPAIQLAREGVEVSSKLAKHLERHSERLKKFDATKAIFFDSMERPLKKGDMLIQSDLAHTFEKLQTEGAYTFYQGDIASAIVSTVQNDTVQPGLLTLSDMMNYAAEKKDAVFFEYRDYYIFTMGSPSSAATTIAETLNILEHLPFTEKGWGEQSIHYLNEAQKIAFYDRAKYSGDNDFTEVPEEELLSDEYAKKRSELIQPQKPMRLSKAKNLLEGMHTSHISIVDKWGNAVSFTTTIENPFGSGMIVPGYGFFLNNELTDFEAEPFDENGNFKANAIQGGKKPRSSMSPTFVFKEGKLRMVLGSPGGSTIIGTVINILVNKIDFNMSCEDAVKQPRIYNRFGDMELEGELYEHPLMKLQLELWGHDIKDAGEVGNAQVICLDPDRGFIEGVSDPRGIGMASGRRALTHEL